MPPSTTYKALSEPESRELLEKYNPLLVLRPNSPRLNRPGAIWGGRRGRGDYHPCSAEFFLDQVTQYDKRRPFYLFPHKKGTSGSQNIQDKLKDPTVETNHWELDVTRIQRSSFGPFGASRAWREYRRLLQDPQAKECVTYARALATSDRVVLQYFYLYLYNDAANTHEGDWEMVALELKKGTSLPERVGFSGHQGGARRVWEGVTRRGDRPVVFVARGAHAAYVDHMPGGHHTAKLTWAKGLPGLLQWPVSKFEGLISNGLFFLGVKDFTASVVYAGHEDPVGPVSPEVRIFPEKAPLFGQPAWDEFWWMNVDCRWGSSRPRVSNFIAPPPAWKQGRKWDDPLRWINDLPEH